jgi:hypothetical protein
LEVVSRVAQSLPLVSQHQSQRAAGLMIWAQIIHFDIWGK